MRFLRLRSISRRIQLLRKYGKLVLKKLTMNVFGAFVFLAGLLLGAQRSSAQATSTSPLTAVDNVDLRRYAGKWYETLPLQFNAYKIPLMRNLVKRAIGGVEEATWAS